MLTINALPPHGSCRPSSVAGTRHASRVLAALTLLSLTACTTEHVTAVDVVSVRVEPAGLSAREGEHHRFSAVVLDDKGVPVPGAEVDWSSGNPAVAAVDENGMVEALREGFVEIRATFRDAWGTATVEVLPARKIAVSPDFVAITATGYESSPEPEVMHVTNDGFSVLSGLSVSVRYPEGAMGQWLKADLASPTAPTTLTLTADPDRLGWGTHRATVLVASEGVGNSPVEIPVTLIRVFGSDEGDDGDDGDEGDDGCEANMSCGLLAHWKLDDGTGDTADDSAHQMDNPGTLVGDTPPEWIAGQVGGALKFAGGNRVEITGSANHSHWHFALQNKSVSFWFRWRPADAVGAGYMIGKFQGGTPGTGWHFTVGAEDKLTFNHRRAAGGSRTVTSTTVINTETWYHVVFTLTDGGLANFYINGDLEDTNGSFDDLNNNTNKTVGIGASGGDASTNTFGGDIDDVRFYAHPLSQQEIGMLYQCGLAGAC